MVVEPLEGQGALEGSRRSSPATWACSGTALGGRLVHRRGESTRAVEPIPELMGRVGDAFTARRSPSKLQTAGRGAQDHLWVDAPADPLPRFDRAAIARHLAKCGAGGGATGRGEHQPQGEQLVRGVVS